MLNFLCCNQMENNMFVLLNNFETFIFLSKNIFHGGFNTNARQQMQVFWPTIQKHKNFWVLLTWLLSYGNFGDEEEWRVQVRPEVKANIKSELDDNCGF